MFNTFVHFFFRVRVAIEATAAVFGLCWYGYSFEFVNVALFHLSLTFGVGFSVEISVRYSWQERLRVTFTAKASWLVIRFGWTI